jgi:hypothetical protein
LVRALWLWTIFGAFLAIFDIIGEWKKSLLRQ